MSLLVSIGEGGDWRWNVLRYYLPTPKQARELLYQNVGENPVLWESLVLDIHRYGAEWMGFVYYYSIENQQFMIKQSAV